jgi:chemotaxis protein methyltransferase WspC
LGLADHAGYYELLMRDHAEVERLVEEVVVPETWFFRYPASFELLAERCRLLLRGKRTQLRMLSVACASGEEPYGMTMAALHAGWPLDRVVVNAIDRREASLETARAACFGDNSFRDPVPEWAKQWFTPDNRLMRVDQKIISRVRFSRHDVLSNHRLIGRDPFDFIFCRNLLIYLGDAARTQLAERLSTLLSPLGLLFVGHAEMPLLSRRSFQPTGVERTFSMKHRRLAPVSPTGGTATGGTGGNSGSTRQRPRARNRSPRIESPPAATPTQPRPSPTLEEARSLADSGRLEEALVALLALASRHPAGWEVFELIGSVQLGLGRLDEARDAFNKVLYFEPDHEPSLLQLAMIFDRHGNPDQASRFRRRAIRAHDQQLRQSSKENQ